MVAKYIKGLRHLETGVRWAAQHRRHLLSRAKAPQNTQGAFYLDLLAFCCQKGEGNEVLMGYQREALSKFLKSVVVLTLSDYRKAVRSLRSEMEYELQHAFREVRPALVQAGDEKTLLALDKITSLRWEELDDAELLGDLSRGLKRLRGLDWPILNTLY